MREYVNGEQSFSVLKARTVKLGDPTYGQANILRITEDVTIDVAEGNTPAVATTANMAPADSIILGGTVKILTAPGGGATALDVGITGGGNLDGMVDGMAVTLGTEAQIGHDGDGNDTYPSQNTSAATLTLTTDADVTTSAMVVRITLWYQTFTPPA
jgi:hypothetical protein